MWPGEGSAEWTGLERPGLQEMDTERASRGPWSGHLRRVALQRRGWVGTEGEGRGAAGAERTCGGAQPTCPLCREWWGGHCHGL